MVMGIFLHDRESPNPLEKQIAEEETATLLADNLAGNFEFLAKQLENMATQARLAGKMISKKRTLITLHQIQTWDKAFENIRHMLKKPSAVMQQTSTIVDKVLSKMRE
jgi:hypothetical protein